MTEKVLCIFKGMLVIMSARKLEEGKSGRCPECGAEKFHERCGWIECDCGFALDKGSLDRIMDASDFIDTDGEKK